MGLLKSKQGGGKRPYFGVTGGWLTFWVSVACSTDMTLFGYDQGVFGGVIVTQDFLDTLNLSGPEHTSLLGTVTALYDVGCFFGAVAAFSLGERLGRKKSVLLGTTVMSIGAILQISSYSTAQMIVGRIVAGLGNGLNTATAPVWQAETSKAAWRGKLVVIELILNIAGFSLSNWVTYGFSYVDGPVAWRFPLAFQFIFIFILFGTVPWLPESPRWLIAHGQVEEGEQIIADLEAKSFDDVIVVTESKEIQWAVQYEREHGVGWADLLRGRSGKGTATVRRLILGAGAQAMQQLAGINVIVLSANATLRKLFYPETADRTLEDIDRLFRENENIFVFRDRDAISSKRPLAYIEHEQREIKRNSSAIGANPEAEKYRMEAIERVNKEQSDEEKRVQQLEKV